jgi:hypothetical protein
LKFGQIFSCHHFISLWFEILTWFFCIIVYNHKLQISFEIRSGWMIFGQLTDVGLWNLAKYLVVIMTRMSPLWILRRLANVSPFFNSLNNRLRITNYCLRSVSSSLLKFTRFNQGNSIAWTLNDSWPTYSRWALKFGQIFSCHHFFFTMIWDIDLIFGMWVYSDELPIKFVPSIIG